MLTDTCKTLRTSAPALVPVTMGNSSSKRRNKAALLAFMNSMHDDNAIFNAVVDTHKLVQAQRERAVVKQSPRRRRAIRVNSTGSSNQSSVNPSALASNKPGKEPSPPQQPSRRYSRRVSKGPELADVLEEDSSGQTWSLRKRLSAHSPSLRRLARPSLVRSEPRRLSFA